MVKTDSEGRQFFSLPVCTGRGYDARSVAFSSAGALPDEFDLSGITFEVDARVYSRALGKGPMAEVWSVDIRLYVQGDAETGVTGETHVAHGDPDEFGGHQEEDSDDEIPF